MKTINKLLSIALLSGLAFAAMADSNSSRFSCAAQAAANSGLHGTENNYCPAGRAIVQLANGDNKYYCITSDTVKKAKNSVCEVNPSHWAAYTSQRHICKGTPSECAVQMY